MLISPRNLLMPFQYSPLLVSVQRIHILHVELSRCRCFLQCPQVLRLRPVRHQSIERSVDDRVDVVGAGEVVNALGTGLKRHLVVPLFPAQKVEGMLGPRHFGFQLSLVLR